MQIKNDQIHPELRPIPLGVKVISKVLTTKWGFRMMNRMGKLQEGQIAKGIDNQKISIKSNHGGPDIRLRVYRPQNNENRLPVLLYNHGGGYAMGSPEQNSAVIKRFIETRPCVVVAPGYRNSQTAPYPAAFHDCYDTLLWIRDHADSINGDASKIMIGGHSAGGGLTAALTLKARDTKDVNIAFQMPIYPMIDDRHQNESSQYDSPGWGRKSNHIGWDLYLKGIHQQKKEIPSYAAPARNTDYSDFPPTFTFVGGIDPFRDETIQYVKALQQYDIPVKFQLFEGCYHGFEMVQSKTQIAKDVMNFLFTSYAEYYDQYL